MENKTDFSKIQTLVEFWLKHECLNDQSMVNTNENDDVLFVIAGMIKLKHHYMNVDKDKNIQFWSNQTCVRVNDLDSIGDKTHLTSFDMLGFFSINNNHKFTYIEFIFHLLINFFSVVQNKKINLIPLMQLTDAKLDMEKIYITLHDRHDVTDERQQLYDFVLALVKNPSRIIYEKNNIWHAGQTGPMGSCVEFFYELPNGEKVEIANIVSMEYVCEILDSKKIYRPINFPCIDIGIGLERLLTILFSLESPYDLNSKYKTTKYRCKSNFVNSHLNFSYALGLCDLMKNFLSEFDSRKIADHFRTTLRMFEAGITPGSKTHRYIQRKLVRNLLTTIIINEVPIHELTNAIRELTCNDSRFSIVESYISKVIESEFKLMNSVLKMTKKFLLRKNNEINNDDIQFCIETYGANVFLLRYLMKKHSFSSNATIFVCNPTDFTLRKNDNNFTNFVNENEIETYVTDFDVNAEKNIVCIVPHEVNIVDSGYLMLNNVEYETVLVENFKGKICLFFHADQHLLNAIQLQKRVVLKNKIA